MPRALRVCSEPGCHDLTRVRRCAVHRQQDERERDAAHDQTRGTAAQRGYDSRWRRARLRYLRAHPLCVHCQVEGRVTAATVVDHVRPHKGDAALFWDEANWQPLCKPHHDRKTNAEDGGGWRPGGGSKV